VPGSSLRVIARKNLRQVITACGEGAQAAYSAQLYVEELMGDAYLP